MQKLLAFLAGNANRLPWRPSAGHPTVDSLLRRNKLTDGPCCIAFTPKIDDGTGMHFVRQFRPGADERKFPRQLKVTCQHEFDIINCGGA